MNPKRLLLAIVVVFAGIWVTDFLIHGIWLANTYKATASLWRPEAEMQNYFPWLMAGQFLAAASFVVLWARGFAEKACLTCAVMFGLFMGLFAKAGIIISYAVQPMPGRLIVKWFVAGVAQGVLMGLLVLLVYKSKSPEAAS